MISKKVSRHGGSRGLISRVFGGLKPFQWLLLSSGAGNLADGISLAFLPMVAVSLSRGPSEVSWIESARQLPLLFLALQAGILLDRINRRICVFYLNILRAILLLVLAIFLKYDFLTYGVLLFFALSIGAIEAVNDVAMPSILPEISPKEDLAKHNGILSSTETATNYFLGRSLGSTLAGLFSSAIASSVASCLYAAAAIFMGPLSKVKIGDDQSPAMRRSLVGELREGLGYVWREKNLRSLALMGALGNAAFGAVLGTLILYATEVLRAPEWTFGLLQSAFAIGSIILGIRVGPIIKRLGEGRALTLAVSIIPICFLLTGSVPHIATLLLTSLINGGAAVIWNTVSISYRQRSTPAHLLGRATSVFRMVSYGAMPVGTFVSGSVAEMWGLKAPYFVAAVLAATNIAITLKIEKRLR